MSRAARRLFLHVSALSDLEYDVYTAALRDVMDLDSTGEVHFDEDIVNQALGLREVRAWMKGRYQDVNHIDKVGQKANSMRSFSVDRSSVTDPETFLSRPWTSRCYHRWPILCCSQACDALSIWLRSL